MKALVKNEYMVKLKQTDSQHLPLLVLLPRPGDGRDVLVYIRGGHLEIDQTMTKSDSQRQKMLDLEKMWEHKKYEVLSEIERGVGVGKKI